MDKDEEPIITKVSLSDEFSLEHVSTLIADTTRNLMSDVRLETTSPDFCDNLVELLIVNYEMNQYFAPKLSEEDCNSQTLNRKSSFEQDSQSDIRSLLYDAPSDLDELDSIVFNNERSEDESELTERLPNDG